MQIELCQKGDTTHPIAINHLQGALHRLEEVLALIKQGLYKIGYIAYFIEKIKKHLPNYSIKKGCRQSHRCGEIFIFILSQVSSKGCGMEKWTASLKPQI